MGKKDEAAHWRTVGAEWPDFAVDPADGLMFAPGTPYAESHRHFSHLMAFHPLGLLDVSNGPAEAEIIRHTLATLDRVGPDYWCGYSYAWLGNLKARAFDGDGAAKALGDFASCFCLPNSFHVNGDQSRSGKSKFVYRPFTLEGNFAFAAGIQEMLLQSYEAEGRKPHWRFKLDWKVVRWNDLVRVFPAVPAAWADASFDGLRADGAFIISARRVGGHVREVRVRSEKGGLLRLANPFHEPILLDGRPLNPPGEIIEKKMKPGQTIVFSIGVRS